MPRIAGIDIPEQKRTEVALTYIFGVGRRNVKQILAEANVNADKRAKDLATEEVARLQRAIDKINTEGNLRKQIRENIERLKRIGTYRGLRHAMGLPVHGQRTRTNARTKRGKRKTIGAMKKEELTKHETPTKE
ncbi:MAG: 30S ribosomal protein S13 [Candidatus Chisholmbacteria bacterium RIFCSPHIGHO2_12_FULL_49_9]|uniref:Small ribosomal subunit protein uS13 n=1 Tax=Candidatus Chisholmbacteria bacterium RIFCSPHIGHO2_01_FULL_52_32 TaxID=1797591 RepID=A0A1G1VTU2_9BACT|nr:MAG: 30S ribosomal protein S13 [Candidatus Chisholmbacteria bacterium RIFCSPHIGHO2_01_FULL_52_32]OGY19238.1 MAG: 30S ribosomal protein S13 [Candidatus Chisholmbacteria bacterium RIFCSPHIGHO2_12_FULL_49_9]OGY19799.1 MAG: 30S ribosomal protein S13 [Candidatus Chisholmbacteria bacterium RIFCSPLOWO2_01_FULL_50_28]